jgi:hypothetical protein
LKSQKSKVKEFRQRKEKNYAEVAEGAEIAEKRKRKGDGNTPTRSGQAPVTGIGTQRPPREEQRRG